MLQIEGSDTGVLNRRMRHHAEQFRPLIDAIVYTLVFESAHARDDEVHVLRQSRTGPGSFGLYLADGREFHFRPDLGQGVAVAVHDAYRRGQLVRRLSTPAEARNFVRGLARARLAA